MYQVTCPEDVRMLAAEIRRESRTDDQESDLLSFVAEAGEKHIRKLLDLAIDAEDDGDNSTRDDYMYLAKQLADALEDYTFWSGEGIHDEMRELQR